jgi:thiol-disulfide isomerase/thioredoxin
MRLLQFVCVLTCAMSLAACTKQPVASPDVVDSESQAELAADKEAVATEEASAEPDFDYGEWLRLPEGLDRRFREPYPTLVKSAIAGDVSAKMNLALLSQQIASTLARADKIDEAYEFVLQSGRALREGLPQGAEFLPQTAIANIYFNEASALARSGKATEAVSALEDAIDNGFTDLEAIDKDAELAPARETEGYAARREAWQSTVQERFMAAARHDLEEGQTFPFTFAGADVHGVEQSLEALQGKVVIVDIWGTWCPPCRAEIPSFVQLQDKYGAQGFQMIGLNYERKESPEANLQAVLDFAKEFSINYPCLLGDDETRQQVPGFRGFPTTLFIDRTGKVRMQAVGLHDLAYLDAVVSVLLAEAE